MFLRLKPRLLPTRAIYSRTVSLAARCPSCSSPLTTSLPACLTCGYISGISSNVSFHEIFRLPTEPNPFVVDSATLRRRFLEAQTVCHPDSWVTKGSVSPSSFLYSHDLRSLAGRTKKIWHKPFQLLSMKHIRTFQTLSPGSSIF